MKRLFGGGQAPVVVSRPGPREREQLVARLPGDTVTIEVRRATRARRMTLRIPPGSANPIVTIPLRAPLVTVERFVKAQEGWLVARLAERAPSVPFVEGMVFPLRGEHHVIRRTGAIRGTIHSAPADPAGTGPAILWVAGTPDHTARRVTDWLRRQARADIEVAVREFAARAERRPSAVRIKDTRAQWGSCSPSGILSFSWRLVLAPPFVLRYVAAHEVAHLVELNHSAAFWAVNARLDPNHERARAWLKRHGRTLHAIGAGAG